MIIGVQIKALSREIGHASKIGHYVNQSINQSIECHRSSKVHLSLKKKKQICDQQPHVAIN